MEALSLGERLKELRGLRPLGLRELAKRCEISPSFLCEIEAGRDYPSDRVLERLASELGVSSPELRKLDHRPAIQELRNLLDSDPAWGEVFRHVHRLSQNGKLTAREVAEWLSNMG